MTQSSRPQAGNCSVNPAYVDAGPWSADEWAEKVYAENTGDENTTDQRTKLRGVVPTFDDMLVVGLSPPARPVTVETGAGLALGHFLFNSAQVVFSPTMPGIASRTDKVVIVENNTNVAYTGAASGVVLYFPTDLTDYSGASSIPPYSARLAILAGNAVTGNPTALVQTANYWMIELARYNVSNLGGYTTLVDNREFANIEKIVGVASAENDSIKDALVLGTEVNDDVGAAGLGVGIKFRLENSAGTAEDAGQLAIRYTDPAAADETRIELRLKAGGADNLAAVINSPAAASADGNARGAGAVDFQQLRGAATAVASGAYSTISGGYSNTASDDYGVVGGGCENDVSGGGSTVGGGLYNVILTSDYSVIAGGGGDDGGASIGNRILGGTHNAITGGIRNYMEGGSSYCFIGGGQENTIISGDDYATICGGYLNFAGPGGFVGGGNANGARGLFSVSAGGSSNEATGDYAVIPGGFQNTADGDYSFAAGRQADTNTFDGVFIWADSEAAAFTADRANQFKVRASGGAHFVQNAAAAALPVVTYEQQDVDEPFHKMIGDAAAATLTRDLVAEADVTTATRVGFYKIEILDDGNQIADGDYFVAFYSLA